MAPNRTRAIIIVVGVALITLQGVIEVPLGRISGDLLSSLASLLGGTQKVKPWIGRIKTASGTASIIRGGERLPATLGAPVYPADTIETGSDGSIGITFIDDSVFSTGPDSRLELSEFHFNNDDAHGDMLAELKTGTLAVVSGQITHTTPGALRIKTPTSILGVRGTTFAVEIGGVKPSGRSATTVNCPADPADVNDPTSCAAAGPPPQERYIVLPNADGRPGSGAITVTHGSTATMLDQPYAGAELRHDQEIAVTMDATRTLEIFQKALDARPMLPAHFRLNFLLGSDQMTPRSAADYGAVLADIKKRQTYEVKLIGYTDALASDAYNKQLSLKRAEAIRSALVKDGIDLKAITVEGRGETEPLVATAAGVAEPRNRRVEITIR